MECSHLAYLVGLLFVPVPSLHHVHFYKMFLLYLFVFLFVGHIQHEYEIQTISNQLCTGESFSMVASLPSQQNDS